MNPPCSLVSILLYAARAIELENEMYDKQMSNFFKRIHARCEQFRSSCKRVVRKTNDFTNHRRTSNVTYYKRVSGKMSTDFTKNPQIPAWSSLEAASAFMDIRTSMVSARDWVSNAADSRISRRKIRRYEGSVFLGKKGRKHL
jgi:hypothetical protein